MVFPVKTFAWERVALDIKMVQQREEACPLKPIGRRAVETTSAWMCACLHIN